MIRMKNVSKTYNLSNKQIVALKDVNMEINKADYVSIVGSSGSGKSTLLAILALLTNYQGEYYFNGIDVNKANSKQRQQIISQIGLIFQNYNLIEYYTVKENILLGVNYLGNYNKMYFYYIVNKLKITQLLDKYPGQLSGGEKQRVAIARVLVGKRQVILADEPTGALDSRNGNIIMDIFADLNDLGVTIIMVSHDYYFASKAKRIIKVEDGHVFV